jgi:hypothetical protein
MTALSALDRIVRQEARLSLGFEDEVAADVIGFIDLAATQARCNRRITRLPLRRPVPYVGIRAGAFVLQGITFRGWSGWRGDYSYAQLHGILNGLTIPGMTADDQGLIRDIFGQNCMVYRYRFQGTDLRRAGYIGSATGASSLRQRLSQEIRISFRDRPPRPGGHQPEGLEHVMNRLRTSAGRASFRLDIGSIVPPGVRNASNIFYLEKLLQSLERPLGNPSGVRTFEDLAA